MQITDEYLRGLVADLEGSLGEPAGCLQRIHSCALDIGARTLGIDWMVRNVFPDPARKNDYFRANAIEDLQGRHLFADRTIALGEAIYNLQNVPGFDSQLAKLRSGDIEGTLAALEGAAFLVTAGCPFHFKRESGVKGVDHDGEVGHEGNLYPVELKAKVEGTSYSLDSLSNTLDRARKQLPKGSSCLVFVRIPVEWSATDTQIEELKQQAERMMRRSTRLAVTILEWERWHPVPPPAALRQVVRSFIVRRTSNPLASLVYDPRGFPRLHVIPGAWKRLQTVVCDRNQPPAVSWPPDFLLT